MSKLHYEYMTGFYNALFNDGAVEKKPECAPQDGVSVVPEIIRAIATPAVLRCVVDFLSDDKPRRSESPPLLEGPVIQVNP